MNCPSLRQEKLSPHGDGFLPLHVICQPQNDRPRKHWVSTVAG
jgi:hypothetical protein